MPYDKFYDQWVDAVYDERGTLLVPSSTELTAASLDHIEDGIATAQATADAAVEAGTGVPASRQITAGTGLTGGGDLTADRSLAVSYGTTAGTAAQGNDSRLSDARAWALYGGGTPTAGQAPLWNGTAYVPGTVATGTGGTPTTRLITAGAGLTGGGDLSADRTLAVNFGTTTGTVTDGGDSRLSDQRGWTLYGGGSPSSGQVPAWNGTAYVPTTVTSGGAVSDATTTSKGVVQLAGALAGTAAAPTVPRLDELAISVKSYGAVGNGTTDDTAAIKAALAACPSGGRVWLPPGLYAVSSSIVVPANITLEGSHGDTIWYTGASPIPCAVMPTAGFSGTAVFQLLGKADTSPAGSVDQVGTRIRRLTIDGTNLPGGGNIRGVMVAGNVREATFEEVTVRHVTGAGWWFGAGPTSGLYPASLRIQRCLADTCGNNGWTFSNVADSTIIDCNALGNTNAGFYFAGFMNGQVANCRAEWSTQQGFYITSGFWGTGQGSGGANFLSCSTDRSGYNGIYVDATGSSALQFTNCTVRRDGRNNGTGGGGFAGVFVAASATMPVVIDNLQVYPGVDDNGTGTNSPQIGVSATGANPVALTSGYVFAATTPIAAGPGMVVSPMVGTATGATGTPTRVAPTSVGNHPATYPISEYGLVTATVHPDVCIGSSAAETTSRLGLYRVWIPAGTAINGLVMYLTAAAAGAGAGTLNRYAVYSDAGALLGSTADDTTLFTTTGARPKALTTAIAAATTGQFVYVGFVHQFATTAPHHLTSALSGVPAGAYAWKIVAGAAVTTANYRVQVASTTATTTLPATFTPAAATADNPVPFMGVY